MKSIEFLEEQVQIYERIVEAAEQDRDDLRHKLEKAQTYYESSKLKRDGLIQILELVREDFKKYGDYNPAG